MMPQALLSAKLSLHVCHNRQQIELKSKWHRHMKRDENITHDH